MEVLLVFLEIGDPPTRAVRANLERCWKMLDLLAPTPDRGFGRSITFANLIDGQKLGFCFLFRLQFEAPISVNFLMLSYTEELR